MNPPPDVLAPLMQYGVLGTFTLLLLLYSYRQIQREQARADAATAEVARLNEMIRKEMTPALVQATQAVSAAQSILQHQQYQRDVETAAKRKGP